MLLKKQTMWRLLWWLEDWTFPIARWTMLLWLNPLLKNNLVRLAILRRWRLLWFILWLTSLETGGPDDVIQTELEADAGIAGSNLQVMSLQLISAIDKTLCSIHWALDHTSGVKGQLDVGHLCNWIPIKSKITLLDPKVWNLDPDFLEG